MRTDFAAFILSHQRPDRVKTIAALRKRGYTGKIFVIVDDEDPTIDQYRENFGDQLLVFSKRDYDGTFDLCDNFEGRGSVVWARNASFDLARSVGLRYFVQLDDDYSSFGIRGDSHVQIKNLDAIFEAFVDFLSIDQVSTIALAQGGDLLGGFKKKIWLKRKAMNSFFCDVEKPFDFIGRLNDDVNTYALHGHRGRLFFTLMNVQLDQAPTQSQAGGLTDEYLERGTYVKSFYTVMLLPSCVRVENMLAHHQRLHHKIDWPKAVPCILSAKHARA